MARHFLIRWLGLGACLGGLLLSASGRAQDDSPVKHWEFQTVIKPADPKVTDTAWVRNPVDAFVLSRLEKLGLKQAAPTDHRTLLRRTYLDLIGLPPTPEEQSRFLKDKSPGAFERVVDD